MIWQNTTSRHLLFVSLSGRPKDVLLVPGGGSHARRGIREKSERKLERLRRGRGCIDPGAKPRRSKQRQQCWRFSSRRYDLQQHSRSLVAQRKSVAIQSPHKSILETSALAYSLLFLSLSLSICVCFHICVFIGYRQWKRGRREGRPS